MHVEGSRMKVRVTAGPSAWTRDLSDDERARLSQAARAAMGAEEGRRFCLDERGELFVSVTVDGTTHATAVCPNSPDSLVGPWRALVRTARELSAVREAK